MATRLEGIKGTSAEIGRLPSFARNDMIGKLPRPACPVRRCSGQALSEVERARNDMTCG